MAEELELKYDQGQITPFWHKLPFFFLFPFRFGPAVFMACIIGASALAGLALGTFGLIFKGFLVYLGLRYAFNVLELFAKGRFEGESVDHRLWGPEKRPGKLGLVIMLFIVVGINLGQFALDGRVADHAPTQEALLARYAQTHAQEIAERKKAQDAYDQYMAQARQKAPTAAPKDYAAEGDADESAALAEAQAEAWAPAPPDAGPSREQMIEAVRPEPSDPLWYRLQPAWFWMVMVLMSLLLPAAAIVIALEDSFFKALNPLNVPHLIGAMGSAYFALWAFFLSIAGTRQLVLMAGADWPAALRFPVEMAVATYLGLVLFAIMGYALYQFHQQLHLEVDVDFENHRAAGGAEAIAKAGSAGAALSRAATPMDPLERKVQALLAEGNVKEAIAEVKDHMRYDRLDPKLNTRLHALYEELGDKDTLLTHGHQWLTALARAGQGREALAALRKLQAIDAAFALQDGDVVLPVATAAVQERDFALAALVLRSFDKRFPGHKDIPGVFFLGARLLSEQSRQHDKAAQILRTVLKHFPEHGVAAEAQTYLAVLESMIARTASASASAR